MGREILKTVGLSKKYGKETVLKNVDLELDAGKIVGLCGPNGAGKTTLIKVIVGLLRDYKGEVYIDGEKLSNQSKAKISFLPDVEYIDLNTTGFKMAALYEDMYEDFDLHRMEELFVKMQLDGNMPVGKMSKGMREKFQLALALSRRADIYILDEPIAGVDPASRDSIMETIINNYSEDALLIIATHLIQDIEEVLDEVIFLNEGEVTLHDNCDVLREKHGKTIDQLFREEFKW